MTKRELIDQITRLNPTAMPAFLAGFKDGDLEVIRKHLIVTSKMEYLFWEMGFHKQNWGI